MRQSSCGAPMIRTHIVAATLWGSWDRRLFLTYPPAFHVARLHLPSPYRQPLPCRQVQVREQEQERALGSLPVCRSVHSPACMNTPERGRRTWGSGEHPRHALTDIQCGLPIQLHLSHCAPAANYINTSGSANGPQPISTDVARLRHHHWFCLDHPMHTRAGRNRGKTLRQASKRTMRRHIGRTPALIPCTSKRTRDPWFPLNHITNLTLQIVSWPPLIVVFASPAHPPSHPLHACLGPPSWARRSVGLSGHPNERADGLKLRGAGMGQDEELAGTRAQEGAAP
ncbi:hypothetical protein LZ30DRAFT_402861 [Colletotrichum cereale]|nr:hypothetical protein LZ30DRAFT_402861 [Colletotrichum cereale]